MYYIPLIVVSFLAVVYLIGNTHCSIKAYDDLKDGQKLYVCLNSSKNYEKMEVFIDEDGGKYVVDKDGNKQFRITLLDIAGMSVIDESEYEELMF